RFRVVSAPGYHAICYNPRAEGGPVFRRKSGEERMTERLGLGLIPGTGWRAGEIQDVARAAEGAGFDAVFCAEVNNDAIATAQLMGLATRRITVGTWVAHTYLRLPYLCAKAAILAADATGGRMVLGLGLSHQPVNKALGIDMPNPAQALRDYATEVVAWLR